ncbi:MAG TPA: LuxR C-terminal-related transcriptional regulator [Ilumatobacter sp.]|nr:LuxR C-terminal-related transcriptional regulator [Ilumatobacter sp.]
MRIRLIGRAALLDRARSLTAQGTGLLYVGEPGVGKTRLLAETLDALAADDWYTERFVASDAARSVPFGPLISLLPPGGSDRTQQVAGIRRTLAERARGRRTALAVDDAHLLDDASLASLGDLVHHSDVVIVGTARSTEPAPPDLTALWAGDAIERIGVEPLDQADTIEFAQRFLGGALSPELAAQLWDRTRGVPLFLRELLLDATTERVLAADHATWRLVGELRTGARLQELVGARTASLSSSARALLELLAVAEPLAVDLLDLDEGARLDGLEQRGMAHVEQLAGQWIARVDHPLITEALVATIPTRRRIELLRDAAARVVAAGCPAPGDALRVAAWYEECGDPTSPAVALAAGREALASLALDRACELAQVTLGEMPRDGHLLLGEALRLQARAAKAEAALAIAADLADDDETIVRVAMWRSTLRANHADDPAGALALLNAAADRVSAPRRALELHSEAAFLAGVLGRFDVAVETNRRILATAGIDTPTHWTALMNLLFGQVMLADVAEIDVPVDAMATLLDTIAPSRPEGIDLYRALVGSVHLLRGELARCEAEFVPHVQRCIAAEQLHGVTAAILAFPLLYRGSSHALAMATAGCNDLAQADAYLAGPIAHAGHTIALAHTGDRERAHAALADIDVSHTGDLRLDGFIGRARAAVLALERRYDEAAGVAASAGLECIAGTYVSFGLYSLYDAVRYGRADLVADEMARFGGPTAAPLIAAMAAHAVAQCGGDAAALVGAAGVFAGFGARTLVAESLDDAARAVDDEVVAGRAATAAALWRRVTPASNALARPTATSLTDRELDVVERALRREPSKAIAEDLFLSVRTVDNHLAQAYRKLAVGGRDELAAVVVPVPPHPPGG